MRVSFDSANHGTCQRVFQKQTSLQGNDVTTKCGTLPAHLITDISQVSPVAAEQLHPHNDVIVVINYLADQSSETSCNSSSSDVNHDAVHFDKHSFGHRHLKTKNLVSSLHEWRLCIFDITTSLCKQKQRRNLMLDGKTVIRISFQFSACLASFRSKK